MLETLGTIAIIVGVFVFWIWVDEQMKKKRFNELIERQEEYEKQKSKITNADIDIIKSTHKLSWETESDLRDAAFQNEWQKNFNSWLRQQSLERQKLIKRIEEDFKRAQSEMDNMPLIYEKYFDGYNDINAKMISAEFALDPVKQEKMHIEYTALKKLKNDSDTTQSMPKFCGEGSENYIYEYLINTCLSTKIGIAFAYAIRPCKDLQYIGNAGDCYGIIKVTSPSHNKVTNNFDGWLVDFVMLPKMRNQGIMKQALNAVLDEVKRLGAKELYAMVMPDNKASLRVLQHNGFKNAGFGGVDRTTGKHSALVVHKFETTD